MNSKHKTNSQRQQQLVQRRLRNMLTLVSRRFTKAINKALWHPDHLVDEHLLKTTELQSQQEITPNTENQAKTEQNKQLQPLITKRITHLLIYEGFVITNLILVALGALALQGQGATANAEPMQEISERGGSGGNRVKTCHCFRVGTHCEHRCRCRCRTKLRRSNGIDSARTS